MSTPYYNVTRSHRLVSPLIFFRCSIFFSMQNSKHVLRGSEHYYRDILVRFKQPRTAFSVAKLDGNSSGSQGVPRQKDAKPLLTSMFYSVQNRLTKSKNYLWKLHFYPGNGSASPTRRYEVYKTILQALSWTPKKSEASISIQFRDGLQTSVRLLTSFYVCHSIHLFLYRFDSSYLKHHNVWRIFPTLASSWPSASSSFKASTGSRVWPGSSCNFPMSGSAHKRAFRADRSFRDHVTDCHMLPA